MGIRVKSKDALIEVLHQKYPGKYEVLGEYVNSRTPIRVKHCGCGHITEATPEALLQGKGCKICNHSPKLSEKEYSKLLSDKFPDFTYVSGYEKLASIVTLRHKCGCEFTRGASVIKLNTCLCPSCNPKHSVFHEGSNDIATTDPWMVGLL